MDESLRERHTDLLYSVRLRERDAFLYLLFEHYLVEVLGEDRVDVIDAILAEDVGDAMLLRV